MAFCLPRTCSIHMQRYISFSKTNVLSTYSATYLLVIRTCFIYMRCYISFSQMNVFYPHVVLYNFQPGERMCSIHMWRYISFCQINMFYLHIALYLLVRRTNLFYSHVTLSDFQSDEHVLSACGATYLLVRDCFQVIIFSIAPSYHKL